MKLEMNKLNMQGVLIFMINEKENLTNQEETQRQRSFIDLARALTEQKIQAAGRPLTY